MKQVTRRLAELEARQPVGCPSCRWWDGTVVAYVDAAGQGYRRSRPDVCKACGRVVPVRCLVQIIGFWGDT